MCLEVGREMIAAREASTARVASIRSGARVLAEVPCEFIRSCKPPLTSFPRAIKWPFSGVRANVRLEMRALGVALGAVLKVAHKRPCLASVTAALALLLARAIFLVFLGLVYLSCWRR